MLKIWSNHIFSRVAVLLESIVCININCHMIMTCLVSMRTGTSRLNKYCCLFLLWNSHDFYVRFNFKFIFLSHCYLSCFYLSIIFASDLDVPSVLFVVVCVACKRGRLMLISMQACNYHINEIFYIKILIRYTWQKLRHVYEWRLPVGFVDPSESFSYI